MNRYVKAMLDSYLVPVVSFYLIPALILLAFSIGSSSSFQVLVWVLIFPFSVFSVGALLAPFFGPKIKNQKFLSFLMAAIANLLAILIFIVILCLYSNVWDAKQFSELLLIFSSLCFFPSMLGGYLFIGGCEKLEAI